MRARPTKDIEQTGQIVRKLLHGIRFRVRPSAGFTNIAVVEGEHGEVVGQHGRLQRPAGTRRADAVDQHHRRSRSGKIVGNLQIPNRRLWHSSCAPVSDDSYQGLHHIRLPVVPTGAGRCGETSPRWPPPAPPLPSELRWQLIRDAQTIRRAEYDQRLKPSRGSSTSLGRTRGHANLRTYADLVLPFLVLRGRLAPSRCDNSTHLQGSRLGPDWGEQMSLAQSTSTSSRPLGRTGGIFAPATPEMSRRVVLKASALLASMATGVFFDRGLSMPKAGAQDVPPVSSFDWVGSGSDPE